MTSTTCCLPLSIDFVFVWTGTLSASTRPLVSRANWKCRELNLVPDDNDEQEEADAKDYRFAMPASAIAVQRATLSDCLCDTVIRVIW